MSSFSMLTIPLNVNQNLRFWRLPKNCMPDHNINCITLPSLYRKTIAEHLEFPGQSQIENIFRRHESLQDVCVCPLPTATYAWWFLFPCRYSLYPRTNAIVMKPILIERSVRGRPQEHVPVDSFGIALLLHVRYSAGAWCKGLSHYGWDRVPSSFINSKLFW